MKAYYTIEIRDKEGKLLKRIKRRSRSYVRQWNDLIYVQVAYLLNVSIKDTGGVARNIDRNLANPQGTGGATNDLQGIVVGTGATAVTISDYALASQCAEGTSTDQLQHQLQTFTAPSVSGSDCSFTATRVFVNGSGATITVAEIGFYFRGVGDSTNYYFLGIRDVLTSTFDVPDGGSITVVYTIKVTV